MFNISPFILYTALCFYKDVLNYTFLDAPYLVKPEALSVTLPENCFPKFHTQGLCYVWSAEQSFLQLLDDGFKPDINKKYLMITPCQRDEKTLDTTHLEIFLKIELISINPSHDLLSDAEIFFNWFLNKKGKSNIVNKLFFKDSSDLMLNNIEIGSYGKRTYRDITYFYGTGLALPRFTQAMNKYD